MAVNVDATFNGVLVEGTTYNLLGNLDLSAAFTSDAPTVGSNIVFNGNGFVITVVDNMSWPGLFPCDVAVNNLGMESSNSSLDTHLYPGWFFRSYIGGTATNCYNKGAIDTWCGGIFGQHSDGTAIRCYNNGTISDGGGGIFGAIAKSQATATYCYNTASIGDGAGGIYGRSSSGTATNCYNMAAIRSGGGGIFGESFGGKAINCYNRGAIGPTAGGIIGSSPTGNNIVTNCYNTGSITSSGGGIIGSVAKGTISHCYNAGTGRSGEEIVGANPTINMTIPFTCGSTSSWIDQSACFYLTDYPLTFPGSGTV